MGTDLASSDFIVWGEYLWPWLVYSQVLCFCHIFQGLIFFWDNVHPPHVIKNVAYVHPWCCNWGFYHPWKWMHEWFWGWWICKTFMQVFWEPPYFWHLFLERRWWCRIWSVFCSTDTLMSLYADYLYGNFDMAGKNYTVSPTCLPIVLGIYTL